jgi:hypothetical protein
MGRQARTRASQRREGLKGLIAGGLWTKGSGGGGSWGREARLREDAGARRGAFGKPPSAPDIFASGWFNGEGSAGPLIEPAMRVEESSARYGYRPLWMTAPRRPVQRLAHPIVGLIATALECATRSLPRPLLRAKSPPTRCPAVNHNQHRGVPSAKSKAAVARRPN